MRRRTVCTVLALFWVVTCAGVVAGHPHGLGDDQSCTPCHTLQLRGDLAASIVLGSPIVAVAATLASATSFRKLRDLCLAENRRGPPLLSS